MVIAGGVGPAFATRAFMTATFASLAGQPLETAAVIYVGAQERLVGIRHAVGTATAVDLSVRTIAADALAFGADAVVMAHNHPSGDAEPSQADLFFTRRLARALEALDIELKDHLVLANGEATSLRGRGIL